MNLPDWMPLDAWAGYVEMRDRSPKTKMTKRAMELRVKDLQVFHDAGIDVGAVLDQSTANSWTDLYEPKDKSPRGASAGKIPELGKHGNVTAAAAKEWLEDSAMDDSIETKKKFANLLTHMSDYYKEEVSKAKLRIYWEGLKQYSIGAIEKACWAHTQNPDEAGRWMPRNSDIIKLLDGSTVDQASIAWTKVDTAVRTRGSWDDLVFDDPIIHRVVADMGGWVLICSKDDKEYPFVGKEFQQRYRAYRQQSTLPDYPARLTGIANAHNGAQGQPSLPPILVGDPERAKLVLKRQLENTTLKVTA